jgi:glycosyl hydrolase family 99
MAGPLSRRAFLRSAALAAAGAAAGASPAAARQRDRRPLLGNFSDLRRHFVFEYYPWYKTDPWEHWPEAGSNPPATFGSKYLPALGLYDSRATAVMERHARWIAESGAGAIDVSWWGPDSNVNEVIPKLMDVMAAHDIQVTFYVEPYAADHASNYARDLMYLIRNYGDRRRWDCFLLNERADGSSGPVFKSFRTILLPTSTDCHGATTPVTDYAADDVWRRQTDAIRELLRGDFDHLTLLADSSQVVRTQAGGFDGIALFDNYVSPDIWPLHAQNCTARDLVFSFQANPGFDSIVWPQDDPDTCYRPPAFAPGGGVYDWARAADRSAAEAASRGRIADSFQTTVDLQIRPSLTNARKGFFLVYMNSFNEWHEGHQFEPARNRADLIAAQLALGLHNPEQGDYRLQTLAALIHRVVD